MEAAIRVPLDFEAPLRRQPPPARNGFVPSLRLRRILRDLGPKQAERAAVEPAAYTRSPAQGRETLGRASS